VAPVGASGGKNKEIKKESINIFISILNQIQ